MVGPTARAVRAAYRKSRSTYLARRYPLGGYVTCNGVRVYCDFRDEAYTWYVDHRRSLALDQKVLRELARVSSGNVLIDIGAHWGFFTAYFAELAVQKDPEATVIALEPDPNHFRFLQRTMATYAGRSRNLLLPLALAAHNGLVTLYESGGICLHSYGAGGAVRRHEVQGVTLDALADDYLTTRDRVAVIKIDIDGAEPTLFAGGSMTLRRHTPFVFMEFAPQHLSAFGQDPRGFFENLCERFVVYWVSHQHLQVKRVEGSSYQEVARVTGSGVTDLVLSSIEFDPAALTG